MKHVLAGLFGILLMSYAFVSFGQVDKRIIQFSGIVVGEDSTSGVAGVHIFVPKGGRGTTSNPYGYFSMPVLEKDSLIISAVGYEKMHLIIPEGKSDNYTVIIELLADTTFLPEVEIYPYPTEELLKEAILALEVPYQYHYKNMQQSLDQAMLNKMYRNLPMNAGNNYNYYVNQQMATYNSRFQTTSIPLLNPFAWGEFIKSLKRGDHKKRKK
ncbi:MAG: carboxypeptidase-like regulatory domain-containing protein [Reichenbachiella sp.]|uniref:carboxypeptidase-like regulatory domain-containing protein n=1 Tax=Reichenbachiella sp. TaxID=2184521 RepID=UPI0032673EF1